MAKKKTRVKGKKRCQRIKKKVFLFLLKGLSCVEKREKGKRE